MELMEGLTVVATESNGDLDIIAGIIIIGVMIIVFGGIFCYLSNDSTGIAFIIRRNLDFCWCIYTYSWHYGFNF